MNIRNLIILMFFLTVAGFSSGCRKGITLHKHRFSMFKVPMYKQPLGYSSTYARHLKPDDGFIELVGLEQIDGEMTPPHPDSEQVIFPEPSGKDCKLPTPHRSAQRNPAASTQ